MTAPYRWRAIFFRFPPKTNHTSFFIEPFHSSIILLFYRKIGMQSNVPPCKVYYIYYIDVTNLKISRLYYMTLTIHTAFKPGKCQHQPGLSVFTSAPHSSGFSRFCHSMRTKSYRLSSIENFRGHYPLFMMWATRRRLRSMRMLRASSSPARARVR